MFVVGSFATKEGVYNLEVLENKYVDIFALLAKMKSFCAILFLKIENL
jgi:hypothetical protein